MSYYESIKNCIAYRKENNETNIVRFYISPMNADTNIYENRLIQEIIEKFKSIGVNVNTNVDTVACSFNLNRSFIETDEVEAVIEYNGVYPVNMSPKDSAWLSQLDNEGKIRIMVFVKSDGKFVPNN